LSIAYQYNRADSGSRLDWSVERQCPCTVVPNLLCTNLLDAASKGDSVARGLSSVLMGLMNLQHCNFLSLLLELLLPPQRLQQLRTIVSSFGEVNVT
jgi:hypothetical protein